MADKAESPRCRFVAWHAQTTSAWTELVRRHGLAEARRRMREVFKLQAGATLPRGIPGVVCKGRG
jgi:hypothetical protein